MVEGRVGEEERLSYSDELEEKSKQRRRKEREGDTRVELFWRWYKLQKGRVANREEEISQKDKL